MPEKLVEATNKLDIQQLFAEYLPHSELHQLEAGVGESTLSGVSIARVDARGLTSGQLNACLDLVEETSAEDYHASETGWSRTKKRREMKLPDLRYILLSDPSDTPKDPKIVGFVSFMVTYEDGYEVIYIYEIHLSPPLQGKGVGRHLLRAVETIGANVGVEKIMLTVFKANERAANWYRKSGYAVDDFSPPARRLRNGVVKEPTYVILSKPLRAQNG
jgi:N-alpha-acetyltransferase 40